MTTATAAFRADNLGSFLRPPYLLEARRQGLPAARLRELEDRAIAEVIRMQEEVGLPIVTDGEFRRKLFFSTVVEGSGQAHSHGVRRGSTDLVGS
jgi:5-methyltetrahydropteroyltriglutamate--homocysteine methyltransferase